jgi:glycosyltransferase involved in cell wall biosynthesis
MLISAVIPVYNEAESLIALHGELRAVAAANNYQLEIVFVDDGSKDQSWKVIGELAAKDPLITALKFRRNFGKAAALDAGFAAARGDIILTLDADLQDDPQEIPRMLAELDRGFDMVSGYKQVRHDPWHKVLPSRVFNWLVSRMTGVWLHDHNCGYKCYRREVVREIRLYGELHRFVPVLAAARGFRVGEIVVNHRARKFGQSKYGIERLVKGFLDLLTVKFLTGFGERPQHILGSIGLLSLALGGMGMLYLALVWTLSRVIPGLNVVHLHQHMPAVLYSLAALLFGGQMLSMGLLAEMITDRVSAQRDTYAISDRILPRAEGEMKNEK